MYLENLQAQQVIEGSPRLNQDDYESAQWLTQELDRRPFFGFDTQGKGGGKEPKAPSQQEILKQKLKEAEKDKEYEEFIERVH